ncbi:ABC transporter permease subunit [Amycolatopsis sp. CA-126428]|uniref:ABC transporter permease subunit n=1 Tax=Amycolatopsis sp. CA-126428 TaxID=2073158 RepID=UPI000CCFFF77|nr:ABC transporter permease subunit [Amycolatopsis sp. CA-126428]
MTTTLATTGGTAPTPAAPTPEDLKVTWTRVLRSEWLKFRSLRSSPLAIVVAVGGMVALGWIFSAAAANRWPVMRPQARLRFDPTDVSIRGYVLAQLVIGVLGVLIVSGEYGTGSIRATFSAVPTRLPVLWAKLAIFAVVSFVVGTVSSFAAFLGGQAFLSSQHIETTLSAPGVFRAVVGVGLYLTVVGMLGVALGWLIRHTAGAIATLFGLLLVLPGIAEALPDNWAPHIVPYLPSNAGQALVTVRPDAAMLAPWTGFAWFCGYVVVALVAAAVLLKRRDA